ncbi:Nickel uptake substrate-specific transmembrane region [Planctomycetes bacterium Poly30]|uniref:Nickel uptake substrate-specific transmembrane region n=1 Tax=Saltatorellus ferox TaxID=2528018 RepID=A0A518EXZ6_9BACT|nr:Nickel uptake substrate-specific transmembrane region [Planctomycetes bacterium Poly30]
MLAVTASVGSAHDFWLRPNTWQPEVGRSILFDLRVGDHFEGEVVPREEAYLGRFVVRGPEGVAEVPALPGRNTPAGYVKPAVDGLHVVGYESKPRFLTLDATKFTQYLRESGLEEAINERIKAKETEKPGREEFVRCAKSMLLVGDESKWEGAEGDASRPLGLTLEFVPLTGPNDSGPFKVKLLRDGKPAAGTRVHVVARDAKGDAPELQGGVTDDEGVVEFKLVPDATWLFTAIQIRLSEGHVTSDEAAKGEQVDWVSHWASLTIRS